MKRSYFLYILLMFGLLFTACLESSSSQVESVSGIQKADANVQVQSSGYTVEQEQIRNRYQLENMPGSIKHLYVLSAYSGQVMLYSTVKGKVTSSGKRLSPYTVAAIDGEGVGYSFGGMQIDIGGETKRTAEVLQDDGTYGSSIPYLFWWDAQGIYHQHYVSGGQILHISDQPIQTSGVILNIESK